jgi:hypothetical protein
MKSKMKKILERELERIEVASLTGPLDIEDCKKLEILTRSLKQLEEEKVAVVNPLEGLSSEALLEYIRGTPDVGEPDTKPKPKGKIKRS